MGISNRLMVVIFLSSFIALLSCGNVNIRDSFSVIFPISITIFLAYITRFRYIDIITTSLLTSLLLISYLTIVLGTGLQDIALLSNESARVKLLFANPNFLANLLLNIYVCVYILGKLHSRFLTLIYISSCIIILIALFFVGSRVAIFVYMFFCLYTHGYLVLKKMSIWWTVLVILPFIFFLGFLGLFRDKSEFKKIIDPINIIFETEFFDKAWEAYPPDNNTILIEELSSHLSPSGYKVNHLKGRSQTGKTLFFLHNNKVSLSTETYIASVYLRSDTPQKIVLSNHLSKVVCDINFEWSHCITPIGQGNNLSMVQFRFETIFPNKDVDFYFAEPQLEIGHEVRKYQPRYYPTRLQLLVQRFNGAILSHGSTTESFLAKRPEAWHKGWQIFLQHPLVGVGSGNFAKYEDIEITHSHNIFIQILATQGLVGFIMWFAVGFIMLSSMTARQRRDFFPMLMVAFLMNLTDYTFIHASSLYVFFFTWGCVYFNKIYPEAENKELVSQ